jgi:hypothetical protein
MSEERDAKREVAQERMRDLPGETAGGRIDPATLPDDQREELARRAAREDEEPE